MQLITSLEEMYTISDECRLAGKSIGLVPTMGALHEGHLSLVNSSVVANDVTIISIYVNPLQFNNPTDLQKYPRNLNDDLHLLHGKSVDYVFSPSDSDMYKEHPQVKMDFGSLANVLEGQYRPGHFDGVGVVVTKLFHICQPTRAYFGLKDLQQYLLIKRMVSDLSFSTTVVGMPIVREDSGLAMSSRNQRLSPNGRQIAAHIYQGLKRAAEAWKKGKNPDETKKEGISFYREIHGLEIEYFHIVDPDTLREVDSNVAQAVAICIAGYVEGVRLIDNLYLRQD